MTTFKIEIGCVLMLDESWLVEMGSGDDPIFTFKPEFPPRSPGVPMSLEEEATLLDFPIQHDPWLIREEFFKIDNDPADALKFLREYGVWRFGRFEGDSASNRFPESSVFGPKKDPLPIRFSELIYQRNYFEDALSCKPADWMERPREYSDDLDNFWDVVREMQYLSSGGGEFDVSIVNLQACTFPGPFKGQIFCSEIQDAMRATILLDWMEGREWPRCKECRRVFKRTSKHPQFYCCAACASRARQATFRKNRLQRRGGKA